MRDRLVRTSRKVAVAAICLGAGGVAFGGPFGISIPALPGPNPAPNNNPGIHLNLGDLLIAPLKEKYSPDPNQSAEDEWKKVDSANNDNRLMQLIGASTSFDVNETWSTEWVPDSQRNNHFNIYAPAARPNQPNPFNPNNPPPSGKPAASGKAPRQKGKPAGNKPQLIRKEPRREVRQAPVLVKSRRVPAAVARGHLVAQPNVTMAMTLDFQTFTDSKTTEDQTFTAMASNLQVPDDAFVKIADKISAALQKMTPQLGANDKLVLVLDDTPVAAAPPGAAQLPAGSAVQPTAPGVAQPSAGNAARPAAGIPTRPPAGGAVQPAAGIGPQAADREKHTLLKSVRDELVDGGQGNDGWVVIAGSYDDAMKELDTCRANPNAWIDITGQASPGALPAQFAPDRMYAVSLQDVSANRTPEQIKSHQMTVTLTLTLKQVSKGVSAPNLLADQPFAEDCIFHPARQEYISLETDQSLKNPPARASID